LHGFIQLSSWRQDYTQSLQQQQQPRLLMKWAVPAMQWHYEVPLLLYLGSVTRPPWKHSPNCSCLFNSTMRQDRRWLSPTGKMQLGCAARLSHWPHLSGTWSGPHTVWDRLLERRRYCKPARISTETWTLPWALQFITLARRTLSWGSLDLAGTMHIVLINNNKQQLRLISCRNDSCCIATDVIIIIMWCGQL